VVRVGEQREVEAVPAGEGRDVLEQDTIETVVETDLRLQLNEGLDSLVLTAFASSGFQAPSTDELLVSIRKAMTTIQASGCALTRWSSRRRTPRRWIP
jgi:hypothetical protein